MTYRDRRAARADRLRAWADKRDARSAAAFDAVHRIADGIPLGQPILVGHHSMKRHMRDAARIDSGMRAGIDHARTADAMRSRADNIDRAAAVAIYSDDPDAVDRLRDKIAKLDAQRAAIVAYNRACRKAGRVTPDALALLDDHYRGTVADLARIGMLRADGSLPAYATANLSGNISRLRARLAALTNPKPTWFHASRRDPDVCCKCDYYRVDHDAHPTVPTVLMCPTRSTGGAA